MSNPTDSKVVEILKRVAQLPEDQSVTSETPLADLGVDSLMLIDIVIHIEADLGVDIGDEFSEELVTVDDLQGQVRQLVGQ